MKEIIPMPQDEQLEMCIRDRIMGDLYYSYMPHSAERWKELAVFFREFRTFAQELAPTKPVAFAPNNVCLLYTSW